MNFLKENERLNKTEKNIGLTCLVFGVVVNASGVIADIVIKNLPCFLATSICLSINIFLLITFLRRPNARNCVNYAMIITGGILFPFLMVHTDQPQQSIIYHFILPASFALLKSSVPIYFCVIVNCAAIFYKFHQIFPGTEWLITIIYALVFTYSTLLISNYTSFFKNEFEELRKGSEKFNKMERKTPQGLLTDLGLREAIIESQKYQVAIAKIDHFGGFNIKKGFDYADQFLSKLSKIFCTLLNSSFLISSPSRGEYMIVTSYPEEDALHFIKMMKNILDDELREEGLTLSIGISKNSSFGEECINQARRMLYLARSKGGDIIVLSNGGTNVGG